MSKVVNYRRKCTLWRYALHYKASSVNKRQDRRGDDRLLRSVHWKRGAKCSVWETSAVRFAGKCPYLEMTDIYLPAITWTVAFSK